LTASDRRGFSPITGLRAGALFDEENKRMNTRFSRRHFMGSAAAALGALGLRPATAIGAGIRPPPPGLAPLDPYDDLAKLSSNENPYGPSEKMMASMNAAWKYSNRYGYPDGDVHEKIAAHHGVDTRNIIMHAGSGETLKVAALEDNESEKWVRDTTIALRDATANELRNQGFEVIPSETNFFMVHTGRPAAEVRAEFRKHDVAVGRDFPPMLDYLRVSIGTEEEMKRFMTAWNEIFPDGMSTTGAR